MADEQQPRKLTTKELLELEHTKCEKDPIFFIMKYVWIQADEEEGKGRGLFSLYEFQKKLTLLMKGEKYKRISILKSRQIGITTLCAAYALWYIMFHGDKMIMSIAPTEKKAKIILGKVKFAYDNLPSWMLRRHPFEKKNELSLVLKNGSMIEAASGASEAARGFTAHILFVDEAAFIDDMETIWGAAGSTLDTTDGMAVVLSTPNGVGNWFHKKHTEAKTKVAKNEEERKRMFVPVELPWQLVPGRTQEWRDAKTEEFGERYAKQEYDCDFSTSGDTVINPEIISWYEKNHMKDPIQMRGHKNELWIWGFPIQGREYALICDTGRGDAEDSSTIDIIDIFANEQVAEFKAHIDTDDFPKVILQLGYEYNEGLVIIERESIGWAVVKDAVSSKYRNLYYSPKEGMVMDAETYLQRNYDNDMSKMVPGFSTNVKFRPLVIDSFTKLIEKKALIVHSMRSIEEWKTFIWHKDGKAKAAKGYHDDTVIIKGIYGFLRDTAIRFSREAKNLTAATLDNYVMTRAPVQGNTEPINTHNNSTIAYSQVGKSVPPQKNPFAYKVGKQDYDARWLFS